jgi:hypothetical protein
VATDYECSNIFVVSKTVFELFPPPFIWHEVWHGIHLVYLCSAASVLIYLVSPCKHIDLTFYATSLSRVRQRAEVSSFLNSISVLTTSRSFDCKLTHPPQRLCLPWSAMALNTGEEFSTTSNSYHIPHFFLFMGNLMTP